jgi:hypothetical protein
LQELKETFYYKSIMSQRKCLFKLSTVHRKFINTARFCVIRLVFTKVKNNTFISLNHQTLFHNYSLNKLENFGEFLSKEKVVVDILFRQAYTLGFKKKMPLGYFSQNQSLVISNSICLLP